LFFYIVHLTLGHLIVWLYVHRASAGQSAHGDIDYLALFGLWGLLLFVLFFACRAYVQAWTRWTAAA
jgi:hypothetical protein